MDYGIATLAVGTRVELHPATDAWMRGDRFGDIAEVIVGRRGRWYRVKMDSGRTRYLHPANVQPVTA